MVRFGGPTSEPIGPASRLAVARSWFGRATPSQRAAVRARGADDHQHGARPARWDSTHRGDRHRSRSDSVALAFQMRAIPKAALDTFVRALTEAELTELELATDEALGRLDPEP